MGIKDSLKGKMEILDRKIKARLAVHEMDPRLKKMYKIRQKFGAVGREIDENIETIERMKRKLAEKENE